MKRLVRLCVCLHGSVFIRSALALALLGWLAASPAWSATGTTTITMSTGNSIAITVTPTTETLSEDVVSPGADWTFYDNTNTPAYFPAGVTTGWVYTPAGAAGCNKAKVTTFKGNWNLTAYYTLSPSTAPLALYLADATSACTTPGAAGVSISTNSASPTTLASALSQSQTKQYYLILAPTGGTAISGTTTITVTYTAQ